MAIAWSLIGIGFHRQLRIHGDLNASANRNACATSHYLYKSCNSLSLIMPLSRQFYIDTSEGGIEASAIEANTPIDIERSENEATQLYEVRIMPLCNTNGTFDVSLPIHFRYADPDTSAHSATRYISPNFQAYVGVKQVGVRQPNNTIITEIPTGRREDFLWVTYSTICLTTCGAFLTSFLLLNCK